MKQALRETENGLATIRTWLAHRCAIHYPDHKGEILVQRLERVQRDFGLPSLADLAARLHDTSSDAVSQAVIQAAATNHTYFFREIEVLEDFVARMLPRIANAPEIRIWSAACSSGDEAFTLAILIAEALGQDALRRVRILGTDISAPMIRKAESGLVTERHLDQMPRSLRNRHLEPAGPETWQISKAIRDACTFRRLNLKTIPFPFSNQFHAVFCRNVLYYFALPDQVATVEAIARVTLPGGWLVTSVTENARELSPLWVQEANGIYRLGGQSA
jgi:chemotaxis protein methyltransferase CheR